MTEKQTTENGRFVPGGKGGPGRPKGIPNKTTAEIKAAILEVFAILQREEGKPYALSEWAKANPDRFYPLAARLIPSEARVDSRISMSGSADPRSLTDEELLAIIAAGEPKATESGGG